MTLAKKCDRCGRLYEDYEINFKLKEFNAIATTYVDSKDGSITGNKSIDLCRDCRVDFILWFKQGKESNG